MVDASSTTADPAVVLEAAFHPVALDVDAGWIEFQRLTRQAYARAAFLDRTTASGTNERLRLNLDTAFALFGDVTPPPVNYVFHTAFCCSTLLARALDVDGTSFALKEPPLMLTLADLKRYGRPVTRDVARWQALVRFVLRAMAKPFEDGESVLIKPTNVANNLLADVLARPGTGGVVLLYSSLESFLVSVLKEGEPGRAFVRTVFNVISRDTSRLSGLSHQELMRMTDLQVAALVWHIQIEHYLRILAAFPRAELRTLDCEVLLADPTAALRRIARLMQLELTETAIDNIVSGPAFARDSKTSCRDYDAAVRSREYDRVRALYRKEIAMTLEWSRRVRPDQYMPRRLPRPL
jgi:hypothetical protein